MDDEEEDLSASRRKRARYMVREEEDIGTSGREENAQLDTPITEASEVSEGVEVKRLPVIRKIRIKMSMTPELQRSVTSQSSQTNIDESYDTDGDTPPTEHDQKERWEEYPVREMIDPGENWRVIGLSNVGNTCFTNAILQVFSYNPHESCY